MRIVHTESSLGWGGQELRILSESRGLARRGHEVTLLCPLEARIHAEAPSFGLRTVALPIAIKRIDGLLALRRWLRTNACDVVCTHSSTDSWLGALAALGLRRPIVRMRHISAPAPRNALTRWLYGRPARIVTTGDMAITAAPIGSRFRFTGRIFIATGFTGTGFPGRFISDARSW